jgi:hypothetical protein
MPMMEHKPTAADLMPDELADYETLGTDASPEEERD